MPNTRKASYLKAMDAQTELNVEDVLVEQEIKITEEIITSELAIMNIMKKINRDKILFKIKTHEGKILNNNRIIKYANDHIIITNPFVLFAEGIFPLEVEVNFEDDGIDYSFLIKRISNNGSDKSIGCTIPEKITILKRRGTHRVKTVKEIPVGLYRVENDQEFIGVINDISFLGIGIKFESCYFDFDFFNILKNGGEKKVPIIFNINENYYSIGIIIKYINKNEKDEIIIGAEFSFTENEQQQKIQFFVDMIRKEAIFEKNKQLTLHLIKTAEMEG